MGDIKILQKYADDHIGPAHERVLAALRKAIERGDFAPGESLRQEAISATLRVSHIPVREALRHLEADGLVEVQRNKGARVVALSRKTIEDMMEIRAYISSNILKTAIPLLTEADYKRLQTIIDRQRVATDPIKADDWNNEFHRRLLQPAQNQVAEKVIGLINANIDRYLRGNFYGEQAFRNRSADEHEQILTTCKTGDKNRAAYLLSQHILSARDRIPEDLM
ncbi:MAG: GntR family transcriptional regulator [Clostridiales bacterium]|nr:GntR family transcriptional regulator [Clostridiales bacterium]